MKPNQTKIEYGDFQTPLDLVTKICQKLKKLNVSPDFIIEPTCGSGNFIEVLASSFTTAKKIIGIEINDVYLNQLEKRKQDFFENQRILLKNSNFFDFNWKGLLDEVNGSLLVIGNFPWVTNSQQGTIAGINLPKKYNFQNYSGFEAISGKSNFDISEWMLMQTAQWLRNRKGYLAMLCKTSVARKFLSYLYKENLNLYYSAIYGIDNKKYFGTAVESCLLFCEFDTFSHHYDYDIYESIDDSKYQRVGHRYGITVKDLATFEKVSNLYGSSGTKWRSGIKHDCSEVMEFREINGKCVNGLGEIVEIESTYLFPLLKGSDIANSRISTVSRYLLVTQKFVGESTSAIQKIAPKTWDYLEAHADRLDQRRSRIYQGKPRYSVFGVGHYTFSPYKIAIGGLYKKLDFQLIEPVQTRPVVFDDTVYFLSFDTKEESNKILSILASSLVRDFYSALIFWDEKRPIKASILNHLNLQKLVKLDIM